MRLGFTRAILFALSIHSKMAGPWVNAFQLVNVYPTNFVIPYYDQKSTRSRTRSQESKASSSSVHFTPGGFDRYVKMIKTRPKRESTRRKPSRSFRISKSKLKWGENSWSFFESWRSFRFKDKDQAGSVRKRHGWICNYYVTSRVMATVVTLCT